MRRSLLGTIGLFVVLAGPARAETIENPMYQMWSPYREGATLTHKSETVIGGAVFATQTTTQTLKTLTAEKAVLETTSVAVTAGQTIKSGPTSYEIPARLPKVNAPPVPQPDAKDDRVPKYKQTKGRETLTVGGRKLDCEWVQIEVEGSVSKTWTCNEVPGQLVKSVSTVKEGSMTVTMQLVEWKATKK